MIEGAGQKAHGKNHGAKHHGKERVYFLYGHFAMMWVGMSFTKHRVYADMKYLANFPRKGVYSNKSYPK